MSTMDKVLEGNQVEDDRLPEEFKSLKPEDALIKYEDLEFGKAIGKGAFAKVYEGKLKGQPVAIKEQKAPEKELEKYLSAELKVLAGLKQIEHPNLMRYYGACVREDKAYIITELLPRGDLSTMIQNSACDLPWVLRVKIVRDLLKGLNTLHQREIIHRDIKTENILVDDSWRCVLCDYGFARRKAAYAMTICGTDEFMAPEVLFGEVYDERADIFSLGIVLAELITRKAPGRNGFLERSPKNKFRLDASELKKAAPKKCPKGLLELALGCCEYEPDDRLTTEAALEMAEKLLNDTLGDRNIEDLYPKEKPSDLQAPPSAEEEETEEPEKEEKTEEGKAEEPKKEEEKAEEPKAEEPKAEEPKEEEPKEEEKTEEPKEEKPKEEEPKEEEPKAEEPKEEEPKAEEPKTEEPKEEEKAEEPKAEEPKAEEPKAEEPKAEEPKEEEKAEEPKAEEPKAEEPKEEEKAEEPKAEEPKAEEPKEEEPKTEEPKTEEPKAEKPKEEEKAEQPKTEEPKKEADAAEAKTEESKPEEPKPEQPKADVDAKSEEKAAEPKGEAAKPEAKKQEAQQANKDKDSTAKTAEAPAPASSKPPQPPKSKGDEVSAAAPAQPTQQQQKKKKRKCVIM